MNKVVLRAAGALAITLPTVTVQAADWAVVGQVTYIEASPMPGSFSLQSTTAGGTCSAGAWLNWNAKGADAAAKSANAAAMLAIVASAKLSGRPVTLVGNNSGCTLDNIYLN